MSHYEQRLENDLKVLREKVAVVASRVDEAVGDAVAALLRLDRDLAAQIIIGDHPINRATRDIDRVCHAFVARHLPSAGILRYVSSVLRLTVALERIGDYAVAIAREAVQLTAPVPPSLARDIEMMGDHARLMLGQAMKAFNAGNAELARGAKGMADHSKTTFSKVFSDLLQEGEQGARPIRDLFALLIVIHRLERVGDLAKNICEETIFAATGEIKQPKVYKILFVDAHNSYRSVVAEAIARKGYPEGGDYGSAGWDPSPAIDERVAAFLDQRGHDVHEKRPTRLRSGIEYLNDYHVVVSLAGDLSPHIEAVPFHTVMLRWDVGPGEDASPSDAEMEKLYRELSTRIRTLMETLRGEGTS